MTINFPLPAETNCLIKNGDKVDFQTPIFEKKFSKEIRLNVARELAINPKNIFRHLKKLVGEKINQGDVVAEKKGFFSNKSVKAAYEGIIKEIDHNLGELIIETSDKNKKQILSPFKGEVEKVGKNELVIDIGKGYEFTLKKVSGNFGGEVYYLKQTLTVTTNEVENKIVFAEKLSGFEQVKIEALGVGGFVCLKEIPQPTSLNFAIIKNLDDFAKIEKSKFIYCTTVANFDKIYFYQ
ncbi:hypothetical protein M1328_03210 [Patescibacteria group bacterium]|nr:hypothetical protein [Patescibacteria group bacterium]